MSGQLNTSASAALLQRTNYDAL